MTLGSILAIAVVFLVLIIVFLTIVYFSMLVKEKNSKKNENITTQKIQKEDTKEKVARSYTKESVFKFMEFEKIQDGMIIQKSGKKFLMVIECQGINYDLMSDLEKTSVESGFIQFLNTLRTPIQIHVQTRTVNLEDSLKNYREKLKKIESELISKESKYKAMQEAGTYDQKQMDMQLLEIKRQRNLYDYGRDIIFNTERMSMNKNVLRKKYYVILSYYFNENENENLSDSEIIETAFSDLYTRCQSVIRTLGLSGVNGKVLDSYELVDLLYNAYNREEAENYGIERAQKAEYDSLYTTAPDILQRKMKALEKAIGNKALELAEESIKYANRELRQEIHEKEENFDELVMELAEQLIDENQDYLPKEVAKKAKKRVRKATKEEEEKANGKKSTKKANAN